MIASTGSASNHHLNGNSGMTSATPMYSQTRCGMVQG
jgi:hypothetical protein